MKVTSFDAFLNVVYKIPYRRARAWPSGRVRRASKGILHTILNAGSELTDDAGSRG